MDADPKSPLQEGRSSAFHAATCSPLPVPFYDDGTVTIYHGYALACHGSLARDFDLIAVPWAETVSDHATVLKDVTTEYALRLTDDGEMKNHGRKAYTLSCGFGECAIDLSFVSNKD